jgi:putative transposase
MGSTRKYLGKGSRDFSDIADNDGFEIQDVRIAPDHIHVFLSFPPRYSIAHVVEMLKKGF